MRLAGSIPLEVLELIAAAENSAWPSIKDSGRGAPTNYRYDEHMKEMVPSLPARLRKA
jgi:hypothetical protein